MKNISILSVMMMVLVIVGCAQNAPAAKKEPAPAQASAANPASSGSVINPNPGPGPYSAVEWGMHGDVTVTLDVKDGRLASFTVEALADVSEGVGVMAVDAMPERILTANSIEVDAIAGATITSAAIMKAAAKALADAGLTNSDLKH